MSPWLPVSWMLTATPSTGTPSQVIVAWISRQRFFFDGVAQMWLATIGSDVHPPPTIIVRSSPADPYTSADATTLLSQFRDEWNANQTGIERDLAQLFTGKELIGNTIGIAWVGSLCSSFHYSVVQSSFNTPSPTDASASDLSAHEFGHSWNARHCRCNNYTMNAFIGCANRFHPKRTIPKIISFRDSLLCLEDCGGGDPPPPPGGALSDG